MSDENQVGVEYGPIKTHFPASAVGPILLTVGLGAFCAYLIFNHEANTRTNLEEFRREQLALKTAVQEQQETLGALIYVIALPQDKREKLNLEEPKKLREMKRW